MFVPTISTRTTNIELTEERRALLIKQLLSLGRYVSDPSSMHIDLVMREHKRKAIGRQFYLSVKLSTPEQCYITVAIASRFGGVVSHARKVLKRQLTDGPRATTDLYIKKSHA